MRFLGVLALSVMIPCVIAAADSGDESPKKSSPMEKKKSLKNLSLFKAQKSEESEMKVARRLSDSELSHTNSGFFGRLRGGSSSSRSIQRGSSIDGGLPVTSDSNKSSPLVTELPMEQLQLPQEESSSPSRSNKEKQSKVYSPARVSYPTKRFSVMLSPSQSSLKLEKEEDMREREEEERRRAQRAEINLCLHAGDLITDRRSYLHKRACTLLLEDSRGRYPIGFPQKALHSPLEGLTDLHQEASPTSSSNCEMTLDKDSMRRTPKSPEVELYQTMLQRRGVLPVVEEGSTVPTGSSSQHIAIEPDCKKAIEAINRFNATDWQAGKKTEKVQELFDIEVSMLEKIHNLLSENIKDQGNGLSYYTGLLFSTVNHLRSEDRKAEGGGFDYHKQSLLSAIARISSEDSKKECFERLQASVIEAAAHILSENTNQEAALTEYGELIYGIAVHVLKKHQECLDSFDELAFSRISTELAKEIEALECYNELLKESQGKSSESFALAEEQEGESRFEFYNRLLFGEAEQKIFQPQECEKQKEYHDKLRLRACELIFSDHLEKSEKKYGDDLALLREALEHIKYVCNKELEFNGKGSSSPGLLPSYPIDMKVAQSENRYFEEILAGFTPLQDVFELCQPKEKQRLLREALKALAKIEAINRAQKAGGEASDNMKYQDYIRGVELFLNDIQVESKQKQKKMKKKEKTDEA